MRCSVNRLLQLATKPRLQPMRSDTSSHVWPSARSKISRARRASSARCDRLLARRVSSISSEFVKVIASLMDAIIVYKWLLQSTSSDALEINITIDDPKAYAKTWSGNRNFKLRPTWNIKEFICADNADYNEEFINKSGAYSSPNPSKQHAKPAKPNK